MTTRASRTTICVTLAALLMAPPATSTLVPRLGLEDLVRASCLVFTGKVHSRTASWSDERIVTHNVLEVEHVIKAGSPPPQQVVITTQGGEVDDVGLWVPGESRLVLDGRYLIFARASAKEEGTFKVTGMAQGSLRIVRDDEGRDWALPPAASGVVTWKAGELVPALPFLTKPILLDTLVDRIRQILEAPP